MRTNLIKIENKQTIVDGKLDMVIAFDTTGSMNSYIGQVKDHVSGLVPQLLKDTLIDKAKKVKKSMATAYKEALEFIQNNPIKDVIDGENRVLRGYKMQFVSRDGKYRCMDMDIKTSGKETGERLVNINTISVLIYNGVKYIVE